jgi:streptomycin 6-kinase
MSDALPAALVRNVTGAFPSGADWLARFPDLLSHYLERWNLQIAGRPFDLSYHYVVPVNQQGDHPAVLKMGVPTPELLSEVNALQIFDGRGAVRLLESDPKGGALLLERIQPGHTLATCSDPIQACSIAAQVMRNLENRPSDPNSFRSLESWTNLDRAGAPLEEELLDIARNLRTALLQDQVPPTLLHADLHHFNILYGENTGWVAIDPKGVMGDPCYEPATFLLNPNSQVALDRGLQAARISAFAEHLGHDRARILHWAFVHSMLSAWWTIEDGGENWEEAEAAARLFHSLL